MKKTILALSLLICVAAIQAQTTPTDNRPTETRKEKLSPDERAKKEADRMAQKLGLTDEQKTKWESLALARVTANQPYREKMQGCTTPEERKDIRKQMHENNKSFKKQAIELLTPEQKQKLEEAKKERHGKGKPHHGKQYDGKHHHDKQHNGKR